MLVLFHLHPNTRLVTVTHVCSYVVAWWISNNDMRLDMLIIQLADGISYDDLGALLNVYD